MQPVTSQDNFAKNMKDLINTGYDTPLAVGVDSTYSVPGTKANFTSWPETRRGPLTLNIGGVGGSSAGGLLRVASRCPKWLISPAGQGKSGLFVSRKEAKPQVAAQIILRAANKLYISKV